MLSRKKIIFIIFLSLSFFLIFYFSSVFTPEKSDSFLFRIERNEEKKKIPWNEEKWEKITSKLRYMADNYDGEVAIYLKDLTYNKVWEYNADRLFISASLIKLPIMISVLDRVENGNLSLDDEFMITDKDRMDGSGSLKWAREGTRIGLLELIYKMITESDNTAAKLLIDYFGIDYFQHEFKKIGLAYTNITVEGMDLTSGRVLKENYTTAREMSYLLEKIYRKQMISKNMSELMLDILKQTKYRTRIKKGVPYSWEVGHKTGLLRRACSDVAIVFSPNGDYILSVLTQDNKNYRKAKKFITEVSKTVSEFYKL